jgi:hypothetical protein
LPSLITGAAANTTRNLAALPAVCTLPAVGFYALADWLTARQPKVGHWLVRVGLVIWLVMVGSTAVTDYFLRWGQSPEVRGAYQQNLVAILAYLAEEQANRPVILSTVYPGPAHDPSIALVLEGTAERRWVDGRYALILPPQANALIIVPQSTPLHPAFAALLRPLQTLTTRPDDLDPAFTVYELATEPLAWEWETAANLNDAVTLRHAEWLNNALQPGETAELLTIWQVQEPARLGPIVPPAFTTDVTMFTQILAEDGRPLAQRDSLEAPSWDWQAGDIILQIHPIPIPANTPPGSYPAIVGIYDRISGVRLPLLDEMGTAVDDNITVPSLQVTSP